MWTNLLFSALLWGSSALAATGDDPLPQGTKARVLDISGRVATIEPRIINLTKNAPTGVAPTVNELTSKTSGVSARETAQSVIIEMSSDVLFDFDHADLRPSAEESLNKIAQFIAARGKPDVLIEGYTDSKGRDNYNKNLSLARAESVRRWLVQKGGPGSASFSIAGRGAMNPVAPNTTPDGRDNPTGRQQNRRVEITIQKNPR